MRTRAGHNGYLIAFCDHCRNTTEFIGPLRGEETVMAQGWTVRNGSARCPACTQVERMVLTRALRHAQP